MTPHLLFVCTHNRCRSILCEAIVGQRAGASLRVSSAGSAPAGEVFPATLEHLQRRGYDTKGLTSKYWDSFQDVHLDRVITVCDSAAGETCPLWLGSVTREHWPLTDPSKLTDPAEQAAAFDRVIDSIEAQVATWILTAGFKP